MLAGPGARTGSPVPFLHLLVCADLTRRCADLGLSPDGFRKRCL